MQNLNDGGNVGDTNSVCNAGEASPPCSSPERGTILIPTCKVIAGGACVPAGADPGVFRVSATGTGRVGTACVGVVFDIATIDPTFDTVRFTPRPAGLHVTLPGTGSSCIIDFTFDVLKSPTGDQNPAIPGNQTAQSAEHTQWVGAFGPGALSNFARVRSNGTTVVRAGPPTITTIASPNINVGGQLTDQATVSGLVNPVAGASVTFRLYPPTSPACTAGTEVFTDSQLVTLAGTTATATSAAYTPPGAGTYYWVATYGGDANNLPVAGGCAEATETRTVAPPGKPVPPTPGTPPKPGEVCTTPPGPAPAGGVLCEKGVAAIRGRTGCEGYAFKVVVTGRQISSVTFAMDGKVIRRLTKPNSAGKYSLPVNPRKLRLGIHRIVARTIFVAKSGTKAKTLRVTFSKCARRASAPAFTG